MISRLALGSALAIVGCSPSTAPSPVAWGSRVPSAAPAAMANQPVVARGVDTVTLQPISPAGATVGVAYRYDMPHCGIKSPIDIDGSFWDAIGVAPDSVDFDGQVGVFRLTSHDTAVFRRSDGRTLNLVRHAGAAAFQLCS